MRSITRIRPNHRLAALLILLVLPIFIGSPFCSKDEPPVGPDPVVPTRKTPTELLQNWFPAAYEEKDSLDYDVMLHPEFQFEFIQEDADRLIEQGVLDPGQTFWGRTLDLRSTGGMFKSTDVGRRGNHSRNPRSERGSQRRLRGL
jgi:hypothetical protein